jgi:hypothetical protein
VIQLNPRVLSHQKQADENEPQAHNGDILQIQERYHAERAYQSKVTASVTTAHMPRVRSQDAMSHSSEGAAGAYHKAYTLQNRMIAEVPSQAGIAPLTSHTNN